MLSPDNIRSTNNLDVFQPSSIWVNAFIAVVQVRLISATDHQLCVTLTVGRREDERLDHEFTTRLTEE